MYKAKHMCWKSPPLHIHVCVWLWDCLVGSKSVLTPPVLNILGFMRPQDPLLQQLLQPQLRAPLAPLAPLSLPLLRLTVSPDPPGGWLNTKGFWDFSLWATVINIASTWSLFLQFPSSLLFGFFADVSNSGMEWASANCCATSVPTWMESWRSHLFPTRIRGTSVPKACCLHSSIQAGRLRKLTALVTS